MYYLSRAHIIIGHAEEMKSLMRIFFLHLFFALFCFLSFTLSLCIIYTHHRRRRGRRRLLRHRPPTPPPPPQLRQKKNPQQQTYRYRGRERRVGDGGIVVAVGGRETTKVGRQR